MGSKKHLIFMLATLVTVIALFLYNGMDLVSYFMGFVYGLTIIFILDYRHDKLGTLYIDDSNPEDEKWRIELENGYIAEDEKKVILSIKRTNEK